MLGVSCGEVLWLAGRDVDGALLLANLMRLNKDGRGKSRGRAAAGGEAMPPAAAWLLVAAAAGVPVGADPLHTILC